MKLHIADNLSLPIEAVTQTFAILAKRGVGKTYLASVMAEEMLKVGQPIIALDPVGAMWGLRSGFAIVVMGGEHGDIPLEESAGEVIASAIVENRFSAVIDLSLFRKGQMIRFMTAFAETLYRLNRDPVHLFVDEADAFAPQGRTFGGDENRMLGAMEDIVRRGRKRGLGCTLITQRPAVLNKNVLTQCESLFALRLVHPKDIDAVMEWVRVHAEPSEAKTVTESLPSLGIGEAWFWSPGWMGALKRIKVRERETFDSSATPKPGQAVKQPKTLAKVDLAQLGEKIKATVEKAKGNDPKELRRKIAELEKHLRKPAPAPALPGARDPADLDRARQAGRTEADREWREKEREWQRQLRTAQATIQKVAAAVGKAGPAIAEPAPMPRPAVPPVPAPGTNHAPARPFVRTDRLPESLRQATAREEDAGPLTKGERVILAALIQYPDGLRREQLTVLTGYKRSSRDTYIQRLRERGHVTADGERVQATAEGTTALPDAEPLPTGEALRDYWLARLSGGERAILAQLIAAYPASVERAALDEATGYQRSSRDTYLQRLRARQLVLDAGRGEVRASETLFDGRN